MTSWETNLAGWVSTLKPTTYTLPVSVPDTIPASNVAGTDGDTETTADTVGGAIVDWGRTQVGKPYRFNATGPDAYDSAGFVQAAYLFVRIPLPRYSTQDLLVGRPVTQVDLMIGDLVFPNPAHVQIYSGNGNVIEVHRTGKTVREVLMWGFFTARRVPGTSTPTQ